MLARLSVFTLACFSAILLVWSCDDETKSNNLALIGRWEIVRGFRNQKATETLIGTYFQFGDDGKMQTNLPIGPEEPMDFSVNNNEIRQKSTPPVKYIIKSLSDSSLVLDLELRGMQFEMHFQRAEIPAPSEPAPASPEQDTIL